MRLAAILEFPKQYGRVETIFDFIIFIFFIEFPAQVEIYKNIAYKCRREIEDNIPRILAYEGNRLKAISVLIEFYTRFVYREGFLLSQHAFFFMSNLLEFFVEIGKRRFRFRSARTSLISAVRFCRRSSDFSSSELKNAW